MLIESVGHFRNLCGGTRRERTVTSKPLHNTLPWVNRYLLAMVANPSVYSVRQLGTA